MREKNMTTATPRPASIRLSARLNSALNAYAKQLKISKDALVRRALEEKLEDMHDLAIIEQRRNEPTYTLDEVKAHLAL